MFVMKGVYNHKVTNVSQILKGAIVRFAKNFNYQHISY